MTYYSCCSLSQSRVYFKQHRIKHPKYKRLKTAIGDVSSISGPNLLFDCCESSWVDPHTHAFGLLLSRFPLKNVLVLLISGFYNYYS